MNLAARIEGIGLVGPGLAGWSASRDALTGRGAFALAPTAIPAAEALPATERRRAGKCVRLSLAAGLAAAADAGRSARDMGAVFASSTGDGENLHAICEALASDDRLISPTRFHNSVHNAPSGYWGIATGSTHAADSLAAFDASFGAGVLEAFGRIAADPRLPVLLIAYDAPYPEPLAATRPIPDSFAVALALASPAHSTRGPLVSLDAARDPPTAMEDEALERLRAGIPAARALPLLALIARGTPGRAVIEYLDGLALGMQVRP
ncbi:MAG: beta-ketoacyl synthase chain length factor [Usitatibacter sp.]